MRGVARGAEVAGQSTLLCENILWLEREATKNMLLHEHILGHWTVNKFHLVCLFLEINSFNFK